jgi:hypothetical protein
MSPKFKTNSSVSLVFRWCSLLTLIYILGVLLLPYSQLSLHAYDISSVEYRLAVLLVNLPVIGVWFVAFWGYAKLKQYAFAIRKTKDGRHFEKLAYGSSWLAWSLPLTAVSSRIFSSIGDANTSLHPAAVIVNNYISLILSLIAFLIISEASKSLLGSRKLDLKPASVRTIMAIFIIGGVLYCFMTLRAFDSSSQMSTKNPYFLPAWLMIVSVIIPYLFTWFIGMLAVYEITVYSRSVKGILYKRALTYITLGLTAILLSFIATQYLSNVWHTPHHLIFDSRLVIITLFRVVGGLGFISMASGANRLKKIEEV